MIFTHQLRYVWFVCATLTILIWPHSYNPASAADEVVNKGHRVVTLAPHLAEVVIAAGAGEYLIGVISGTDYPASTTKIPIVGGVNGIDFEKLITLEPTMVLGWDEGTKPADIVKLQSLGIPVRILSSNRLVDLHQQIIEVGGLFGTELIATESARVIFARILKLSRHQSRDHQKKIFIQIWDKPIFTIGRKHLINEGLQLCGAVNVAANYPFVAGAVSMEAVVLSGADSILDLTGNPLSEELEPQSIKGRHLGAFIPTVEGDANLLMRPGPRFLDGLETLCMQLRES